MKVGIWICLSATTLATSVVLAVESGGKTSPGDLEVLRLIRQLGSDDFDERESATARLKEIGASALPALQQARSSNDAEVRQRATALIVAIRDARTLCLDLRPHLNQPLNERFHDHLDGNDLAALPTGKQTLAGIRFTVGEGVVQLRSGKPDRVEGIKVGTTAVRLHFLHACGRSGGTSAGTLIGKYVVHYDDASTAEVEIVYGKDMVDWWEQPGVSDPSRSAVAWQGRNQFSTIKLFLTTWQNPRPDRKIATLDFVATAAAPFCVAISAER